MGVLDGRRQFERGAGGSETNLPQPAAHFCRHRQAGDALAPGKEVAPGIVTLPAPGHTPGHTVFAIHSGKQSLLVLGDTAQHPAMFARHPNWEAAFDVDGPQAVATRKKIFDRAAADRMLITGYHFPFPACGHLIKTATGYEHVPIEWQTSL